MAETLPFQIQTFSAGIEYDGDPELVFSKESPFFIDGHNVDPTSNDGNTGAVEKAKGEVQIYGDAASAAYKCVGTWQVRDFLVEFFGPTNPSFPGICRVNGVVVLESTSFTLSASRDLDGDKNESEENCEVSFTDKNQTPFIFDINDMVDSLVSDPNKYFSNFDPLEHQINIQSALDHPVFVGLEMVGGGGGKPVGKYQYQLRYASSSGDRTQWSHPTPLIPVMQVFSSDSSWYPWSRTFGGPPNPSSKTAFAPKIRFRVTNLYDYEFIEIKCIEYNGGGGMFFSPVGKIVARIDIKPGEIGIKEYIDPSESNVDIALSPEDESRELAYIETCESIRYFDRRLTPMGVTVPSRDASGVTFRQEGGKEGWPVIHHLGKSGHKDPLDDAYYRSEMRGERAGYGVTFYDSVGNHGFVKQPDTMKDYQLPNRRDPVSSETYNYSFGRCVKAATTATGTVDYTHEVFDLSNAIHKSNQCDFKNIIERGRQFGLTGTKTTGAVNEFCNESDPEIENHNTNVSTIGLVSTDYLPFTPTSKNDADTKDHNYVVNTKVAIDDPLFGFRKPQADDQKTYRPIGMAPDYYAMGMMMAGVENMPPWVKSFAVVRTESAQKVVAQGIGYYALTKGAFKAIGSESLGGKKSNEFWFYSPDCENGTVSSDTVNDIIDNPHNYKVQFVSPLGFFSEWYSAEDNLFANKRDRCIDMINYVRIIRDLESGNTINPSEDSNMGIGGGDGNRYIDYGKYRNINQQPATFSGNANKGNALFDIIDVDRKIDGRGSCLNLALGQHIYGKNSVGGNSEANFEDDGLKDWTEPIYIINIVRVGAKVSDRDIQKFRPTSHYQKVESIIGKSTGEADQVFPLVDERWEDCIPSPNNGEYGSGTARYLYIKKPDGTVEKWRNVTYLSAFARGNVIADINGNIGDVRGVYTHTNVGGGNRFFEINFDIAGFYPEEGSLILVRYDSTAPIRFFGGDAYISEAIFAPIDGRSSARDDEGESQFALGIGLPFKNFQINPRYYTIRKAGASVNSIQDSEWFTLGFIRQLCVMFTCETRSGNHLAHNVGGGEGIEFFPLTHYVIRPNRWDYNKNAGENYVFDDYVDDYGANEKNLWKWGGFRFLQSVNPDYTVMPAYSFFSKPEFGFVERRKYPNRIMWSLQRNPNVQNAPGLRTFPANNAYDIEDDIGKITFAYDANTERGDNLYAITEKGVALLVTRKTVLSDLDGGQLGYMASGQFITNRLWISKSIGIPAHMAGSAAEASVPITLEDKSEIRKDALFFANGESVFRMMDNNIVDIGRSAYHTKLYNQGLSLVQPGSTRISAVFDGHKKQYYLALWGLTVTKTFAFSQKLGRWVGTNSFFFEKFTSNGNKTYGHREMQTYELNQGYEMFGGPVVFRITAGFAPESPYEKEFVRVRVNSAVKPTKVAFFKEKGGTEQCSLDSSALGPLYLKNYGGWSQFISRIKALVNPNRPRLQARHIIVEVTHSDASDYVLKDIGVQYKPLVIQ